MTLGKDIKDYARSKGVYVWELANAMSISEAQMTRILRGELHPSTAEEMKEAIDRIAGNHPLHNVKAPRISSGKGCPVCMRVNNSKGSAFCPFCGHKLATGEEWEKAQLRERMKHYAALLVDDVARIAGEDSVDLHELSVNGVPLSDYIDKMEE